MTATRWTRSARGACTGRARRRVVVAGCRRRRRPDPGEPDRAPAVASPPPTPPPVAVARSRPGGPAPGRRPARPADRVVVLHGPPSRAADGRRYGFEYVIFRAERGALPDLVGLAPRDHRRDRRPLPVRPAARGRAQVDRSPRGSDGEPTGFDLALTGRGPDRDPDDRSAAAAVDDGRRRTAPTSWRRRSRRTRRRAAGSAGRASGLDLDLAARRSRRPSTTGDGWIDFGPAGGSYYYSRTAMTATGTLTLDGETLHVDGRGLVRPPVGRLHLGRWRRLGLVRGQPRRRHGPDAVARPRRRRQLPARLRHARRTRTGRRRHLDRDAFTVDGHGPLDEPGDRRDYPAGWTITIPGEDLTIDARADGRGPGAGHAGDDRRHLLGGLAGRRARRGGGRRSVARRTWS